MTFLRAIVIAWLLFVVPAQGSARALVDSTVKSFVKRCDVFVNTKNQKDTGARLTEERRKLAAQKVPITIHLDDCENTRYKIQLKNGGVALVTFGYPTNADPDYKGDRYEWVTDSPSSEYWRFNSYAWGSAGWLLVHQKSGKKIETNTECIGGDIFIGTRYVATMCAGVYVNEVDTLYVADISSEPVRWSKGLQHGFCPNDERFSLYEFQSPKPGAFAIEYGCDSGGIVKASFRVDDLGLNSRIRGVNRRWEWDR